MPKIKPVMAWGLSWKGRLIQWAFPSEEHARTCADATEKVVRVEIRIVQPKRKVKLMSKDRQASLARQVHQ